MPLNSTNVLLHFLQNRKGRGRPRNVTTLSDKHHDNLRRVVWPRFLHTAETAFCTPPVMGGAALFDNSTTPLALNCRKGQHLPALEVYKNQSPMRWGPKSPIFDVLSYFGYTIVRCCLASNRPDLTKNDQ